METVGGDTNGVPSDGGGSRIDKTKTLSCPYSKRSEEHPYIAPKEGDDRSPCPALNTLANHGFLPRNGRGLTASVLIKGLQDGYRVSYPLAAFLAYGGVLLLGQVVGFGSDPSRDGVGFSLHDLARHDRTEHDASITHPNTPAGDEYAPIKQEPALFDAFVKEARPAPGPSQEGVLSYGTEDIARIRVRREAEPGTRIDAVRQEIGRGESALVLGIFGFLPSGGNTSTDEAKLPEEIIGGPYRFPLSIVESWWKEERFPTPDWAPVRETTLLGTLALQGRMRKEMQSLREKESNYKFS
ncbi:Cloroperoxidase [Schizopora paradoxa]|uniref:Cloroperoxidase n=1 Tax=Schizopora paradoxa TaxID=27342 RepID=A0A0H2SAD0_9AGAM|nr:Cloroperoxidase [Schizopora paradoxa]